MSMTPKKTNGHSLTKPAQALIDVGVLGPFDAARTRAVSAVNTALIVFSRQG